MSRRATTLGVAVVLLIVLIVVGDYLKVPYVVLQPGPVTDTLGNIPADDTPNQQPGGPVISISGTSTHATNGHLYLTTVEEVPGDCSDHPSLLTAVKAWFAKTQTVEPQQAECPPGQTSQQVQQQGEQEMSQSQSDAITAALFQLGYTPTSVHVTVNTVQAGAPAGQYLDPGDEILSVNGSSVTTVPQIQAALSNVSPGTAVKVAFSRDGKTRTVAIRTVRGSTGKAIVGFTPDRTATFAGISVKIGIDPDVIGGPSAGSALALGIIDKLTPGGLTGGRTIAGTGTMDGYGNVGAIGGIQQKVAGAHRAGATVFFSPQQNCADAKAAAPKSMKLVEGTTLSEEVKALETIKAGGTDYPHC